jgi:hypothetical protein
VLQVVLGEILDLLGSFLGSSGGPGGEFLYSTPGYLALIDAAALVGGIGVSVPLNTQYQNDLGALKSKVNAKDAGHLSSSIFQKAYHCDSTEGKHSPRTRGAAEVPPVCRK